MAALLVACHDSSVAPPPPPLPAGPALEFSGAAGATDTVDAILPQLLAVEVRDSSGALAPAGTAVTFYAYPVSFGAGELYVHDLTSNFFNDFATAVVDQEGKVRMFVRLGRRARVARLAVTVPSLALTDTVRFTVKAGNAIKAVIVTPTDTALYVGKSYTVQGGTVDRYDNPRADPVTFSSPDPAVTVTSAGVVTGTALGRALIRSDAVQGSLPNGAGFVTVVPPGRFAGAARTQIDKRSVDIFAVDADGTNRVTLATVVDGGIGTHAVWLPGTSTIVYSAVANGFQKLFSVNADNGGPKLFLTAPVTVSHQAEPMPSADGKWLFFSAYDSQCSTSDYCVARSRPDGSGYELLSSVPSRQPAPSPDGSKVAFVTPGDNLIRVYDAASRAPLPWSVVGSFPAWSPDGTRIAYRNSGSGVSLIAPDGSGNTVLSTAFCFRIFGWSPDGKWLLVQQPSGTTLIDPATGTSLPLFVTTGVIPASMK